ncbi:MAG TPA: hypothetical protein VF841_15530, partial [Anaeromyxobacter sp.]
MIGDHIRTLKGGRWTHAIDCGDETVIVLADDASRSPRVRRSYRPEFVAGSETVEVVLHRERTFPAEEVVARAYSRISDPALAAMFRDSEAFAEWCTTGRLPAGRGNLAIPVPGVEAPPAAPRARRPARSRPAPRRKKPAAKARAAKRARKAKRKTKPAREAAKAGGRL